MRCGVRYEKEFDNVQDVFELQVSLPPMPPCHNKNESKRSLTSSFFSQQRNLNNAFAYDLVPSPSVITAALRAARRVNDFPTAVRIFEGNMPSSWP